MSQTTGAVDDGAGATRLLPVPVGVRFAYACLQALAEEAAADILLIKGAAVAPRLLGAGVSGDPIPRGSADADVLVRPGHLAALESVLRQHEWQQVIGFQDDSFFEHAATWHHPVLAPVDVHRRFPGVGGDPEDAFERLWGDRHVADIAGIDCWVPSLAAQRLLLLLNAARGRVADHPDVRRAWGEATPAERAEVDALASDLSAHVALAAATGRLAQHRNAREHDLWLALSSGERSPLRLGWARVRAQPSWTERVRAVIRMIVPNPRRLEFVLGRRPTARDLADFIVGRVRAVVRDLRGQPGENR